MNARFRQFSNRLLNKAVGSERTTTFFGLLAYVAALACVATIRPARAEDKAASAPADKNELKAVELSIHPAKLPYAALKYRLLPQGIETTAGNAAPDYFRAILMWTSDINYQSVVAVPDGESHSKLDDWLELPLDRLAKNEESQKFYNDTPTERWDMISMAARRERCDWDLPIRKMNIATPIPELIKLRDLGHLLAFKARLEISRGQFDNAIETIKTGLALGQHAAQAPTLINALVGTAISRMMLDRVRELVQQPNSPNLYWTLTALPDPLIDLRTGLNFESDFVYLYLPELHDIRTATHTEAEWDKLLFDVAEKLVKTLPGVGDRPKDLSWYGMGAVFAATAYPKAKRQLADAGYPAARINAMCASQAILIAEIETYEHLQGESLKWFYARPATSLSALVEAERQLKKFDQSKQEIIPLATLMLPALSKVKANEVEGDRYVAALRLMEAIRLHAAENHDQLPTTLADIKSVPVPDNPVTGSPFGYELHGERAILSSPSPPGAPASAGLRWEIQVGSSAK